MIKLMEFLRGQADFDEELTYVSRSMDGCSAHLVNCAADQTNAGTSVLKTIRSLEHSFP